MELTEALAIQAKSKPNDTAIDFVEGSQTYSQLHLAVKRIISHLLQLGVREGDILGLSFADERMILIATLAVTRIGATVFLVPDYLSELNKAEMISAVDLKLLLVDVRNERTPEGPVSLLTFTMLAEMKTDTVSLPQVPDPSQCFMIVHGSGSTGKPKLIPFSHAQMILMCHHQRRRYGNKAGDVWAGLLMLSFRTPLLHAMAAVTGGNRFVRKLASFPAPDWPEICKRQQISFIYATPHHAFELLEQLPRGGDQVFSSLKGLILSFTSVSSALREEVRQRITPNLYISYGTNEVGLMTILSPDAPDLDGGSIGHVIENNTVEVVDSDGNQVPDGVAGEIRVKNDQNFCGYLDDPEATANAVRDGWFYPGDSGRFLPDGQLVHLGRSDHMMIFNGINIYPAEIERAVSEIDGIAEVAVVPLADTRRKDVPVCAFTLKAGVDVQDLDLMNRISQRLGQRAPKQYFKLSEIPRNDQGKLDREALYEKIEEIRKLAADNSP